MDSPKGIKRRKLQSGELKKSIVQEMIKFKLNEDCLSRTCKKYNTSAQVFKDWALDSFSSEFNFGSVLSKNQSPTNPSTVFKTIQKKFQKKWKKKRISYDEKIYKNLEQFSKKNSKIALNVLEKFAESCSEQEELVKLLFPKKLVFKNGVEKRYKYRLKILLGGFKMVGLKRIVKRVCRDKIPNRMNEMCDYIFSVLFEKDSNVSKRKIEEENLKNFSGYNEEFFEFFDGKYTLPREIMRIIFEYLSKNIEFLDKIAIVNERWYLFSLKCWGNLYISQKNVFSIPLVVLKNAKVIEFNVHKIVMKEMIHIISNLNKNVRKICLEKNFEKFFTNLRKVKHKKNIIFPRCECIILKKKEYLDSVNVRKFKMGKKKAIEFQLPSSKVFPKVECLSIPCPNQMWTVKANVKDDIRKNIKTLHLSMLYDGINWRIASERCILQMFSNTAVDIKYFKNHLTKFDLSLHMKYEYFKMIESIRGLKKLHIRFIEGAVFIGQNGINDRCLVFTRFCTEFNIDKSIKLDYLKMIFEAIPTLSSLGFSSDDANDFINRIGSLRLHVLLAEYCKNIRIDFLTSNSVENAMFQNYLKKSNADEQFQFTKFTPLLPYFVKTFNKSYCADSNFPLQNITINFFSVEKFRRHSIIGFGEKLKKQFFDDYFQKFSKLFNLKKDFHVLIRSNIEIEKLKEIVKFNFDKEKAEKCSASILND